MGRQRLKTILATVFLAAASAVQAGPLEGTTANGQLTAPCCGTLFSGSATAVDPGVEFTFVGNSGGSLTADLADSAIRLGLFTGGTGAIGDNVFWTLTIDPSLSFVSISEISDNFVNGADLVSFSGNSAQFRILDQAHDTNQTFLASYGVRVQQTVPEPGTLALIGLSLAGLAASRRRKH